MANFGLMVYTMRTAVLFSLFVWGNLVAAKPFADQSRKQYDSITINGDFPSGDISIPKDIVLNGTALYSPNADASWKFDLDDNSYVVFKSVYFDLEQSQECTYDSLTIVEMGEATKVCGNGPLSYISQSNTLELFFKSDETDEGEGFKIEYDILKKDNMEENGGCNSFIRGGGNNLLFDSEDVCFYRLEALPGQLIELDLKMIFFGSRSCEEEGIRIYRGVSTHGKLLTEICSDHAQGPIEMFEEKLFIEYRRTVALDDADMKGFRLGYKFVEDTLRTTSSPVTTPSPVGGDNECSGFYKDRSSSFGIDYPHYENNRDCIVVVRNNFDNYVIQVTFENFELEEIEGCNFNSVRVIISGENSVKPEGHSALSYGSSTSVAWGPWPCTCPALGEAYARTRIPGYYEYHRGLMVREAAACSCHEPNKVCVKYGNEKQCLTGEVCKGSPCKNGGTCVKTTTSRQCYCRKGYSGDDCSVQEFGGDLQFKKVPSSKKVIRGDNVIETCLVDGDASYKWTINGESIGPLDNGGNGFGVLPGNKYLQINDFNENMEGEYTCTATVGDVSATIIFKYELVESCQTKITMKPKDKVANKGNPVVFICEVERETVVIWKKDGKVLDVENSQRLSILDGSSSLSIMSVEESDEGEYTCEAVDENKCRTQRSAKLTVTLIEDIDDYCGLSVHDQDKLTPRISRGTQSKPADNPWQVTMLTQDGNPFCGASVISKRFIMTAASCISDLFKGKESVKLILGTTDCTGKGSKAVRYPARVIKHPEYNRTTEFNNDIALIELDQALEYDMFIRPICLQREAFYDRSFFERRTQISQAFGKVAGCGKRSRGHRSDPKAMMEVNLPYVSRENCETTYEGKSIVTENMFCAGFDQRLAGDACEGDSGGALVMTDEVRWYQTGIVSHGWGCDRAESYGIFTNVGNYYDWIKEVTEFDKETVERF